VSSVRVITTRYLPLFSSRSRNARPNPRTRFFSLSVLVCVPLSMPPWPGSITITGRESVTAGASIGAAASADATALAAVPMPGLSSGRLSAPNSCTKDVRSVSSNSSTSRAGWPEAASSTAALVILAGPVRSNTIREPPGMTRPYRNAFTRPRPEVPMPARSWKVTCGISRTTRYGSANVNARKRTALSRSRTKRVCLLSPASRASDAIGKFEAVAALEAWPSAARRAVTGHSNAATHNRAALNKTR